MLFTRQESQDFERHQVDHDHDNKCVCMSKWADIPVYVRGGKDDDSVYFHVSEYQLANILGS